MTLDKHMTGELGCVYRVEITDQDIDRVTELDGDVITAVGGNHQLGLGKVLQDVPGRGFTTGEEDHGSH
jgi:hypothetical protein